MNTQEIVSIARVRAYTDDSQLTDPFAALCLSMLYKDARGRMNQFTAEDYAMDVFQIPLSKDVNEYAIPQIGVGANGMDQVLSATVDFYPGGASAPKRMRIARFSSLPEAPDTYKVQQPIQDPFYVFYGTNIQIFPQPTSYAYKFTVSGVTATPDVGASYSNNGVNLKIVATNVVAGSGTITAWAPSATPAPLASGTLVKVSGSGDVSITYSAKASVSGLMKIYAATVPGNLTISTDAAQIVGLPENVQKALISGLVAYFFEARGQYDKSELFWQNYEKDMKMGIALSNERDMAPKTRVSNNWSKFQ